jgi:hypothetical protein
MSKAVGFIVPTVIAVILGSLIAGLVVSLFAVAASFDSSLEGTDAMVIATGVYVGIGALGVLGRVQFTNAYSNFLFTLAAGCGCWLLTRRFVRMT